jgi:aspartate/methionine/tyrosine aminotransferase
MNRRPPFPENDIISLVEAAPRYDLAESVGPDLLLAELADAAALGDLRLAYGTAAGHQALREAIAAAHGAEPEQVTVTVGGMHALFLLAFILCRPGDEAAIAAPCFPLARNALEAVGARLRVLQLSFDEGYRLDPAALRGVLSQATRLVGLASPQNPSGVAIPADTVRRTLELMAEVCPGAYLVMDETYREAVYGADRIGDSVLALSPKAISVASLSKCHGAPGLRLGWAITRDPELRRRLVVGKFNTVICCPAVDEALALRLFERRDALIAQRRARLEAGLQRTASWVRTHADLLDWVRPDAGALCCVRLRAAAFDESAVGRFYQAAADRGVRVANGAWFGEPARIFRLGFGLLSTADLEQALAALSAALQAAARARRPA